LRINTNVSALNAWRQTSQNDRHLATSLERLSSGLRVNRAADDAAGLSISESLRAQVRGSQQAARNVQDALSLAHVAEAGLSTMHTMLQRARELAVQAANGTYTVGDRQAMQDEVAQLLAEIDRTAETTTFNGIQVLTGSSFTDAERQAVLDALQQQILKDAWDAVATRYGIGGVAPANGLTIVLDEIDGAGGVAAFVSAAGGGPAPTLELHVDMADFVGGGGLGTGPFFNDRIIAHELVHAIMFDETNWMGLPTWFMEGSAEFVHGADDRVSADLASMGGNTLANRQALVNMVSPGAWGGTSRDYSAGYVATKYLDDRLRANGHAAGLRDAMTMLASTPGADIDDVAGMAGYANQAAFLADFQASGAAWMGGWSAGQMNLGDADTGSIAGSGYGGASLNAAAVIANGPTATPADWTPWTEAWPTAAGQPAQLTMQVGANMDQILTVDTVSATTGSLGVGAIDLVASAGVAITAIDGAISRVATYRGTFGAQANRLEHTLNNLAIGAENQAAAESRIRDADVAAETAELTRRQILATSSTATLRASNVRPQLILSLLEG
jgi:flagellin